MFRPSAARKVIGRSMSSGRPAGLQSVEPRAAPIVLVLTGPIRPPTLPILCDRIRRLLETYDEGDVVLCDVGALRDTDAGTIDALARLQLTVRRMGREMHLLEADAALRELLEFSGLRDAVPCAELPLEPGRHAEQREPPVGVQEERDPGDPVA